MTVSVDKLQEMGKDNGAVAAAFAVEKQATAAAATEVASADSVTDPNTNAGGNTNAAEFAVKKDGRYDLGETALTQHVEVEQVNAGQAEVVPVQGPEQTPQA